MKRIGFCIRELGIGGAERVLLDLIVNLKKTTKYELYLLVEHEAKNSFIHRKIANEIKVYILKKQNKDKNKLIKLYNSIRKRIVLNLFQKKIDVIIDFCDAYCYYFIKKLNMKKVTFAHVSSEILKVYPLYFENLKNYDLVVACGEGVYSDLKKDKSIKNIDYIPNLIDYNAINAQLIGGGAAF